MPEEFARNLRIYKQLLLNSFSCEGDHVLFLCAALLIFFHITSCQVPRKEHVPSCCQYSAGIGGAGVDFEMLAPIICCA